MTKNTTILIEPATHIGQRELNEDSLGTPHTMQVPDNVVAEHGALITVADGMGGYVAGEVASKLAVEALFNTFYNTAETDPQKALALGYSEANRAVFELASQDATKKNMGTTLVTAVIKDKMLYVANVGDSRAYFVRNGKIFQLTQDHSWVAEQVRAGVLTEEQAKRHSLKNIITRTIGNRPEIKPDFFRHRLVAGDVVILCSDGLSNQVEPHEIEQIVKNSVDPKEAASRLITLALERGGDDNITAIVAQVPNVSSPLPLVIGSVLTLSVLLGLVIAILYSSNMLPIIGSASSASPAGESTVSPTANFSPTPFTDLSIPSTPVPSSTATLAPSPTSTESPSPQATITHTPTATVTLRPTATSSPTLVTTTATATASPAIPSPTTTPTTITPTLGY